MLIFFLLFLAVLAAAPFAREAGRDIVGRIRRTGSDFEFVKLSQGVTAYRWLGPVRGKVIVAIHGVSTPARQWDPLAEALGKIGFRVLVYDLYGRGLSDAPSGPQTPAFFQTQLTDLLEAQGLDDGVTLLGYSMGAMIAADFAAIHPHRVDRVLMIAPAGIETTPEPFAQRCLGLGPLGNWLWLAAEPIRARKRRATRPADWLSDPLDKQATRRGYWPAVLSSRRHMLGRAQRAEHRILERESVPVWAAFGDQDPVIPLSALGTLAQWNRQARTFVVPGADHAVVGTHVDELMDGLKEFQRDRDVL